MSKIDEINNAIKENKQLGIISSKDISDGHHTFGELYKKWIYVKFLDTFFRLKTRKIFKTTNLSREIKEKSSFNI